MPDNEANKAPQTGASGAAWSDKERFAYLIILAEAGGKVEDAPVPAGRSIVSCKKMIVRLKNTASAEIAAIKAGQPIVAGDGEPKTPKKAAAPKTTTPNRKKVDADAGADGENASPKKQRGRPKKKVDAEPEVKAEVKKEEEEEI